MAGLIGNLIVVLEAQAENYENLLALAHEKREVLIENDVKALQKVTNVENVIVANHQRLDRERAVLFQDIAMVLNKKADSLTLSALLDLIREQPDYPALSAVTDKIRETTAQLKAQNDQNKILIDQSMEYAEFSLNIFRDAMAVHQPLGSIHRNAAEDGSFFFDAKQ